MVEAMQVTLNSFAEAIFAWHDGEQPWTSLVSLALLTGLSLVATWAIFPSRRENGIRYTVELPPELQKNYTWAAEETPSNREREEVGWRAMLPAGPDADFSCRYVTAEYSPAVQQMGAV